MVPGFNTEYVVGDNLRIPVLWLHDDVCTNTYTTSHKMSQPRIAESSSSFFVSSYDVVLKKKFDPL